MVGTNSLRVGKTALTIYVRTWRNYKGSLSNFGTLKIAVKFIMSNQTLV